MPHLFTTETKNYRPLDRRNDYPWEIMRERLVRELGNEFATFLAEPVTRASEGFVDWYTESTQPAVPAVDLAEADRDKLLDRLHVMRHRVFALADKIEAPGRRDADRRFADAIRRAMIVPSDERFVWSLNGQPTLLLWGMLNVDDERPIEELLGTVRNPRGRPAPLPKTEADPSLAPPSPAPTRAPPPRRFLLALPLWLLFAALVGTIYYFLLAYCDIAIGPRMTLLQQFGINACTSTFATTDGALRRQQLQDRIEQAELDLARVQGDCETPQSPYVRETPTPRPTETPTPPRPRVVEDACAQLRARGEICDPNAKLQVTLYWNGREDLDLHIPCPGGEFYFPNENRTACGGGGYVDTNNEEDARPPDYKAVENGIWRNPPPGRYKVQVKLHSRKDQPARDIPFTVIIRCGDRPYKTITGRIRREGDILDMADINYPACSGLN
jgi:hypothetical protein